MKTKNTTPASPAPVPSPTFQKHIALLTVIDLALKMKVTSFGPFLEGPSIRPFGGRPPEPHPELLRDLMALPVDKIPSDSIGIQTFAQEVVDYILGAPRPQVLPEIVVKQEDVERLLVDCDLDVKEADFAARVAQRLHVDLKRVRATFSYRSRMLDVRNGHDYVRARVSLQLQK